MNLLNMMEIGGNDNVFVACFVYFFFPLPNLFLLICFKDLDGEKKSCQRQELFFVSHLYSFRFFFFFFFSVSVMLTFVLTPFFISSTFITQQRSNPFMGKN